MKHYVVLDFEMCKVSKGARCKAYHRANEIIQWGAVLLDEDYNIIDEFNSYVKPEYGKLDSFISSFTGITWNEIMDAPLFAEVAERFSAWIPEGDVEIVSWSDNDQHQLAGELRSKGVDDARLEQLLECWIDSQVIYAQKVDNARCYSLEEALLACDIPSRGRAHDGLDDAYNTGLLFAKMMTEPVLKLNQYYLNSKTEESEHLSCCLGDLLTGFNFAECAAV